MFQCLLSGMCVHIFQTGNPGTLGRNFGIADRQPKTPAEVITAGDTIPLIFIGCLPPRCSVPERKQHSGLPKCHALVRESARLPGCLFWCIGWPASHRLKRERVYFGRT